MKKNKEKKEKAPKKVKKQKVAKEKVVQSPEEKAEFQLSLQNFASSGFFKALVALFVCSLVFTMFSSSILRITAIPGALKNRAAAFSASFNTQSNNNNQNSSQNNNNQNNNILDVILPEDTTSVSIDVQGTTPAPTTQTQNTGDNNTGSNQNDNSNNGNSSVNNNTNNNSGNNTTPTNGSSGSQQGDSTTTTTTTKPTTTESATDSAATLKEKKAVLNNYKKVVNAANTIKPGFTMVQYRGVEKDSIGKLAFADVEKNYPGYFVTQEAAEAAPYVAAKFSDMSLFCINNPAYACLLSDKYASEAIKKVEQTAQSDGSTKITIVLRDEENPAVTPADDNTPNSYTSAMFPVLDKEVVKQKLVARQNALVSVEDVNLKYHDCTIELVYMPKTGRIVSLTQTVKYDCTVNFTALWLISGQSAVGNVTETTVYSDFVY